MGLHGGLSRCPCKWSSFFCKLFNTGIFQTSLYIDYMLSFNDWAESIGLQYSNQPGYDFQLDVAASAAIPTVPEIESLGLPLIDEARQLSGGVHLGNRSIFSSETGARPTLAMALTMAQLLEDSKAQFAGHVNLLMLHGYSYSGSYPETTWPGICTFAFVVLFLGFLLVPNHFLSGIISLRCMVPECPLGIITLGTSHI